MAATEGARWRVFISHTAELREFPRGSSYVDAVERAISAAGHVIVDMADFPAADLAPAQVCIDRVQGCDVFVGVLGTRYGSPVRDRPEVSYTELEFDTATHANLDRLVFLLDTDAVNLGIPLSKLIDAEFGARQDAFRRRVRKSQLTTQSFANPDQLARLVERSLRELAETRQRQRSGLVREQVPAEPQPVRSSKFLNPPPATAPAWFQDRQVETGLLARYITDPAIRMVTVVGRGGIGKTAMVCRLLKGLETGRVPDLEGDVAEITVGGIIYLSRNSVHKVDYPTLVADLMQLAPASEAQRLQNLYQDPHHTPAEMMLALLEAFPVAEPVVVLLDNLESVMNTERETLDEVALHEALSAVLSAAAHAVTVVVTTRVRPTALLQVEPARQRQLRLEEGLGSPEAETVLRELDDNGHLGLRDAPEAVLDGLRQHTRGFPRALEAVKAILDADDTLSPRDLLNRTRHLPEDQVVEVLVGEAYQLLDPPAQQVMQVLSVFPAPVSEVGVDFLLRPVNPTTNAAPILSRLVRRQLVRFQDGHYYLHPVDRDYARSHLRSGSPGDSAATFTLTGLQAGAADYYTQIRTPRESWRTLNDLQPQLAEFGLRCATGDYDTAATVLADIDFEYLQRWGHYRTLVDLHEVIHERITDSSINLNHLLNLGNSRGALGDYRQAIDLYTQALAIAREIGDRFSEASALGGLGSIHSAVGHYRQAIDLSTQALAIAREIGDRLSEGSMLGNLGNAHFMLDDYRQAIDLYTQALTIAREIDDPSGEIFTLRGLGSIHSAVGHYRQAIDLYTQALAIAREIGDRSSEGGMLGNLGNAHFMLDDYRQAIDLYTQALTITREIGNRSGEIFTLSGLGGIHSAVGHYRQAIDLYTQALTIAREIGNRSSEGSALDGLGNAHSQLGDYRQAIDLFTQELAITREIGNRSGEIFALRGLGNGHSQSGDYRQAIDLYTQALAIAREIGDRFGEGSALDGLGNAHSQLGDYRQAIDLFTQELAITREIGDRSGEIFALRGLGNAQTALGDYRQAIDLFTQALAIAREIGDRSGEGSALDGLGNAHSQLGDYRQAIDLYTQELAITREIGDRSGEIFALSGLGNAQTALGDYRQAIDLYTQALAIAREIGDRSGEGSALDGLGNAYSQSGDYRQAIDLYTQALAIAREIGDRSGESASLSGLGRAWLAFGDPRQAGPLLQQAAGIADLTGDIGLAATAGSGLARVHLEMGDPAMALDATVAARDLSNPTEKPIIRLLAGVALLQLNRVEEGVRAFTTALTAADALLIPKENKRADVLEVRALALAGLAATGDTDRQRALEAMEAFARSCSAASAAGLLADAESLLDQLAAHAEGMALTEVRAVLARYGDALQA
ncbi:tetratricopeptide repeat protein [Geodermatophilus sp. SYSU D00696]